MRLLRKLGVGRYFDGGGWYGSNSSEFGGDDVASLRSNGMDLQSLWDGQSFAGGSRYTPDTTTNSQKNKNSSGGNNDNMIAYPQTIRVRRIRILLCLVWIICTVTIPIIVYRKSTQLVQEMVITQYNQTTDQIRIAFESIPQNLISTLSSIQDLQNIPNNNNNNWNTRNDTTTTTTSSRDYGTDPWPFVTLASFSHRASVIRKLYKSIIQISIHPIVPKLLQSQWKSYVSSHSNVWIYDAIHYQRSIGEITSNYLDEFELSISAISDTAVLDSPLSLQQEEYDKNHSTTNKESSKLYTPLWQRSPVVVTSNYSKAVAKATKEGKTTVKDSTKTSDWLTPTKEQEICIKTGNVVMGGFITSDDNIDNATTSNNNTLFEMLSLYQSIAAQRVVKYEGDPISNVYIPVSGSDNNQNSTTPTVALIVALVQWKTYFVQILSSSKASTDDGIMIILSNGCEGSYSYQINGNTVQYFGSGDQHNAQYNYYVRTASFTEGFNTKLDVVGIPDVDTTYCPIQIQMYPSDDYYNSQMKSNVPILITSLVIGSFLFMGILFVVYEKSIDARHRVVLSRAIQSSKLVSSLFPGEIADRVLEQQTGAKNSNITNKFANHQNDAYLANTLPESALLVDDKVGNNSNNATTDGDNKNEAANKLLSPSRNLRRNKSALTSGDRKTLQYMTSEHAKRETSNEGATTDDDDNSSDPPLAAPIADLFPNTTVLFADIAGFTAWSSTREPTQVFTLLQGVYQAFDKIAKRRKVFKVETIGDSYVAVTGLPHPQENHAVIMARFAVECQLKMAEVTNKLELQLGPGTSDLVMRTGLHSGPVTGGVLMGEKARFQLFGDTVNTASRMESTGIKQKIQVSSSTASLLRSAGKGHWIHKREDQVTAKGKGVLQTYWLEIVSSSATSRAKSEFISNTNKDGSDNSAVPDEDAVCATDGNLPNQVETRQDKLVKWGSELLLTQIKRIQAMRSTNHNDDEFTVNVLRVRSFIPTTLPIEEVVESLELPECTATSQSKQELDQVDIDEKVKKQLNTLVTMIASSYNNHPFHNFEHACHVTMSVGKLLRRIGSYYDDSSARPNVTGLNSDPITQLALIFSALIHDIDHRGIPNVQLVQEESHLASTYKYTSVAEQNSLDIAWNLLMSESFQDLRSFVFNTNEELWRFRQVVVNAVMATDIMDKDININREKRFKRVFNARDATSDTKNHQTALVLEYLMQASDVAHTMQHWHVYIKWNTNLLRETYIAYKGCRIEQNPANSWFERELEFFDYYVIPLAYKLKKLNAFGALSDEYITYAKKNRAEWAAQGNVIIQDTIKEMDSDTVTE